MLLQCNTIADVYTSNELESWAEDVEGADKHVEETQQQYHLPHRHQHSLHLPLGVQSWYRYHKWPIVSLLYYVELTRIKYAKRKTFHFKQSQSQYQHILCSEAQTLQWTRHRTLHLKIHFWVKGGDFKSTDSYPKHTANSNSFRTYLLQLL